MTTVHGLCATPIVYDVCGVRVQQIREIIQQNCYSQKFRPSEIQFGIHFAVDERLLRLHNSLVLGATHLIRMLFTNDTRRGVYCVYTPPGT